MSGCVCGADEKCWRRCDRHGRTLHGYPCGDCQAEWEAANPRTAAAISKIARGKAANIAKARREDAAAAHQSTPTTESKE